MRMEEERIPKKILYTNMEEKRPRGRPGIRWIDPIGNDLETRGGNWEEIQENRKWEKRRLEISL